MDSVDALVMDRASFDTVRRFPAWPYGAKPVDVLSGSLRQLPAGTPPTVTLLNAASADPAEVVRTAAAAGHRRLYIDGGRTIQSFLAAGLIDELTVAVVPVLLGAGIRLFGTLPSDVPLRLLSSQAYPFSFVQSRYAVGVEGHPANGWLPCLVDPATGLAVSSLCGRNRSTSRQAGRK